MLLIKSHCKNPLHTILSLWALLGLRDRSVIRQLGPDFRSHPDSQEGRFQGTSNVLLPPPDPIILMREAANLKTGFPLSLVVTPPTTLGNANSFLLS